MKLSEIKHQLNTLETIAFELPDGTLVPNHFHVTEVGKVTKDFIDCGGTRRSEQLVNFQLWDADDYDHRLHPEKLVKIIELSEKVLEIGDLEIEVEYQGDTIGRYGLDFNGENFLLTSKATDCLAREKCGVPEVVSQKVGNMINLVSSDAQGCTPGGGCC